MQIAVTITDDKGGCFHYQCPSLVPPSTCEKVSPPEWALIKFNRCPRCTLAADAEICPAAITLCDIVESPLAREPSYKRVKFSLKRQEVYWESELSMQEALGLLIIYRLWMSECPLLAHSRQFYVFFSPRFSYEKVIFQHIAIELMIKDMRATMGANVDFKELDFENASLVCESLLERIRKQKLPISDAISSALCHMHAIFSLLQQDRKTLYKCIFDAIS